MNMCARHARRYNHCLQFRRRRPAQTIVLGAQVCGIYVFMPGNTCPRVGRMSEDKSKFDELIANLQRERDELRVQLQLAKQEIRDRWEPIENKWESLEGRMRSIGEATSEAGKDVASAAALLADEIADGYREIWRELKK